MEIKTTTKYDVSVKAVLRENVLDLSVSVTAPYANGSRSVTVSTEAFPEKVTKAVQKALAEVLADEVLQGLLQKANLAAHEAEIVAVRRGEL